MILEVDALSLEDSWEKFGVSSENALLKDLGLRERLFVEQDGFSMQHR